MQIWIGAEIDREVGHEFRAARSTIEKSVNEFLANRDYATAVKKWALIVILRRSIPNGWGEIALFHRETGVAEFRSILDFGSFCHANSETQISLIVQCLLNTFEMAAAIGVCDPGVAAVKDDLASFAREKRWLM